MAICLYLDRAEGLPADLGEDFAARLYQSVGAPDERIFRCSQAKRAGVPPLFRMPLPGTPGGVLETDCLFNPVLAGKTARELDAIRDPGLFPVFWEGKPFHDGGKTRYVGFLDWSVRLLPEAEFQALRRGE